MQADDPPCLSVGTAVSAKYKGAFCEAKVSNAVHVVKCKISFKNGLGTYTVNDDHVKGTLRIGQVVQARHPEKREYLEATVMKIQDCSQYTVVFDDGDITTLRRSALCLKSGRHFNESETLDQLPLTHPEHFGNPVVGGRRGRRNRQAKEDSSEEEAEEENELDLGYSADIGRVVSIETTDKKRTKDNWFPGLVVIPSAQPTVRINVKDEYLVRSFKDGRYYTVPKKEVTEFAKEMCEKIESTSLSEAVQKAQKYLNNGELPAHWERSTLFNLQSMDSDSDDNYSDSFDDEPSEEKDFFVAQLYKFMEEARTPLNSSPTIAKRDVDLHRLYRIVEKLGGYNRVTNQNKWKTVTSRMRLPSNQSTWNQVQNVYKTYLSSFQSFYRTLGVTMTVNTRSNKKNRGRSLIRDKDRATPVNSSPRPEKEEESGEKQEEKVTQEEKPKKKKEDDKKKKETESDTNTSDTHEQSESSSISSDTGRSKRSDSKTNKEKKSKAAAPNKLSGESNEEQNKVQEKLQQTRSKSQAPKAAKEVAKESPKELPKEPQASDKKKDNKTAIPEAKSAQKPSRKVIEEDKKRGRKRPSPDDKNSNSENSETSTSIPVSIGDKLIVYYGPSIEAKMTYEAKVIDIKDSSYLVHYTGWNTRYDEWILPENIAVNLSAKSKQMKLGQSMSSGSKSALPKAAARRGRGSSITGKGAAQESQRSTTPSSVTSSSSRTKSPATPATRFVGRLTRQDSTKRTRRCSAPTELSVQSDSESEESESEIDTVRTRSFSKTDQENTNQLSKKKLTKASPAKSDKKKVEDTDEDSEKVKPKVRGRKTQEEELKKEDDPDPSKKHKQVKKEDESPVKEEESDLKSLTVKKPEIEEIEIEMHETLDAKVKKDDDDDTEKEEEDTDFLISEKNIKSEDDMEKEIEVEKTKHVLKKLKQSPEKIVEDSDEDSTNLPKGRDFDLNQIRLELKGLKVPTLDSIEKDMMSSDDSVNLQLQEKTSAEEDDDDDDIEEDEDEIKLEIKVDEPSTNSEDIYEFKEPEPFEFETRKLTEEKNSKKRIPRLFEEVEKSPKKTIRSPRSTDGKDSPGGDKKRSRKVFKRSIDDSDDEEYTKKVDAFDKLIESPSYNMGKSSISQSSPNQQQLVAQQQKAVENILEEPLFSENIDVYRTERLDLSDNEFLFTRNDELFTDSFLKSSPDRNLELDFCKPDEPKNKESDEEDSLRESIQRVIAQTSTDEDSNDPFQLNPPTVSYQPKKKDNEMISSNILSFGKTKIEETKSEIAEITAKKEAEPVEKAKQSPVKHISPALQETDSSLLESIVAQPPLLATSSSDTAKDLNLKTGCTKIADTLLQKLMKSKADSRSSAHDSEDEENTEVTETKTEINIDSIKDDLKVKPTTPKTLENIKKVIELEEKILDSKLMLKTNKKPTSLFARSPSHTAAAAKSPTYGVAASKSPLHTPKALKSPSPVAVSSTVKTVKPASPRSNTPTLKSSSLITSTIKTSKPSASTGYSQEGKKRRKVLSRQYIEDSDSDSSDSEQLIIAKSDDDSQTNILNAKSINRGSCSNLSLPGDSMTDDSQSQEEVRNFKFDLIRKDESSDNIKTSDEKSCQETESTKEEDHDPHLHNLLLCEETIPRSPAPSTEGSGGISETKPKNKSVLEMPFASAPASSNNKNILLSSNSDEPVSKTETSKLMMTPENRDTENCDSSAALDNSPPASPPTPESPLCMSPRGEDNLSPPGSCKSNDGESDFSRQRRDSTKISPYSEEDTQMTGDRSPSKKRDDEMPGSCRKRRKSSRSDDIPAKRGRKPLNRSRQNSDSDDTSEDHSTNGSVTMPTNTPYKRSSQTPRPTKYNFYVEFDASVDRAERIAIIMQKLTEIRKTYADVKSELAAVERRRKRLRRREREGRRQTNNEGEGTVLKTMSNTI